ncbi:MAG: hypothetical protein GF313_10215, partial [Caldithrix sp.]|nr:hypothetical protein [Caldithrix sp.]
MAVAKKKYKLFKICKELNLGHETIQGFLEQKGLKVSGPNTSVPEDLYIDILDRFATDREKAEKLKARKMSQQGKGEDDVAVEQKPIIEEGSAYIQALRQSIEAGAEAITRSQTEEKEPKKPKKEKVEKPAEEKEKKIEEELP